jgi:FlaA1/EpsC-like NDP-sugar epimerase
MSQPESFASYPSLQNRVVLITGGASGIGATMVEQFAHQSSMRPASPSGMKMS